MEEKVCTSHCFPFPVFVADPNLDTIQEDYATMSIQIADHIIDPIESYQASAGTLLNRPASTSTSAKPLHWKCRGSASSTGRYTHAYTHLSHLPLSTLHSEKATKQVPERRDQRWMEGASRVWSSTPRKCTASRLCWRSVGDAHYLVTSPAI